MMGIQVKVIVKVLPLWASILMSVSRSNRCQTARTLTLMNIQVKVRVKIVLVLASMLMSVSKSMQAAKCPAQFVGTSVSE